ncbi:HVA22-like protein e [Selaginella moellendorffii]|uniref:HVA22-like protein e n=1 Tax=Selaginella moellendorffii TaxID=88036 RepID=UPI000D1C6A34|nr:HVA22-like protein e [Selaginella moellendorffii]XP_024535200.1 HVA22-like protein e [Selaginella moellendorffii]|eukprot:XP_002974595.2 HVA22-like protein e [Selaginella moellendorffii]
MGAIWAVITRLHAFAGPVISVLYPMLASVKAIESPLKEDDEQWLTYWILYSLMTLLEIAAAPALAWFPLWYPVKLALLCWLVLPQFKGASFVYNQLVRKYVVNNSGAIKEKVGDVLDPQTRSSVERFIHENGLDALDKLLAEAAQKNEKKPLPSPKQESQERY